MVNRYISLLLVFFSAICTFCSDSDSEFNEIVKLSDHIDGKECANHANNFLKEDDHDEFNILDDGDNLNNNPNFFIDANHEEPNAFINKEPDLNNNVIVDDVKKSKDIEDCLVVPSCKEEVEQPKKTAEDNQCCS